MDTKIKLLLLNVNRDGWHSGNMIYDMMSIQHACDTIIYGPGWPNYKTTDLREIIPMLYGEGKPDVIYSYFTPNERVGDVYMSHYRIPEALRNFPTHFQDVKGVLKIFALSDFWSRKPAQYSRDLRDSDFTHCFCCFTPPYSGEKDFYAFFDEDIKRRIKFVSHPRCVDSKCFKDYGLPKSYDAITVGAMWHFYSFRCYMHGVLSANAKNLGIRYKNYPHCGVDFSHGDFVRDKYAMAINGASMLLSCGGRYHVAYNKIFESMGCRTVYVGEKPYGEKELHLVDGENYVAVDKNNFVEKVMYYKNNPSKMAEIAENAYQTFIKHHTIEARGNELVEKLKGILSTTPSLKAKQNF